VSDLISTGEAATLLGVSPRTVARMIDRGDLPGYRVGGHRRVSREEALRRHAPRPRGRPDFSWYIGILLAAAFIDDPSHAIDLAERNLRRQRDEPTQSPLWTERWSQLIQAKDTDRIIEILSDRDDRTGLRQTHPFRGLVSEDQRRSALELSHA